MPRNLSIAEVDDHVISAIEESKAPMGEQDPIWEEIYASLTRLRELSGARDMTIRGAAGDESANIRARNAMVKTTEDHDTLRASQADVDTLLERIDELEARLAKPSLDLSGADEQLDALGKFLCLNHGGMVKESESVAGMVERLLTQERFFHHKGDFYRHVADGQFCTGRDLFRVVIYRDEKKNRYWVRKHEDFHEEIGNGVYRFRHAEDNESVSGAYTWTCPSCGRRFLCAPGYVFCPECDEVGNEPVICRDCGTNFITASDEIGSCPKCGGPGREVS